ncbi:MAG: hypothetical protein WCP06_08475 [Verrucomicrobiota bacterium]
MEPLVLQIEVERKLPPEMILHQFHRLAVWHPFKILKNENAQQHHRFDSRSVVRGAVTGFKRLPRPGKNRPYSLGKKAEPVVVGEERGGNGTHAAEEGSLGVEIGQAHRFVVCCLTTSDFILPQQAFLPVISTLAGVFQRNQDSRVDPDD